MFLDIHEGLCENVLDLVNSRPEPPVLENGRGIPCRARGHGWQSGAATWGIRAIHSAEWLINAGVWASHTFPFGMIDVVGGSGERAHSIGFGCRTSGDMIYIVLNKET